MNRTQESVINRGPEYIINGANVTAPPEYWLSISKELSGRDLKSLEDELHIVSFLSGNPTAPTVKCRADAEIHRQSSMKTWWASLTL